MCRNYMMLLFASLLASSGIETPTRAQTEYTWIGGDGSYVADSNWDEGFPPSGEFDELGVINNGGVARVSTVLSASNFEQPGQLILGQGTGQAGTLIVEDGGNFSIFTGSGADANVSSGGVDVGFDGVGTLIVQPGGTFNSGYVIARGSGGTVTFDGSGVLAATAELSNFVGRPSGLNATAGATLRIIGPNADITSDSFDIDPDGTYVAEITGPTHSAIKTANTADALDGGLVVEFNGYTPRITDTWNLVDAPSVVSFFSSITLNGASLPAGQVFTFTEVVDASSVNGTFGQLGIEQQLVLRVDRDSDRVSIVTTEAPVALDGYAIQSATGGLNQGSWMSLQDAGVSDWRESPQGGSATLLSELKPTGETTVSVGAGIDLGRVFRPRAPTFFGENVEDLSFEYYTQGGDTVEAVVVYEGVDVNNLVLIVDPDDGRAQLVNRSPFDVSIDGYAISSASGSLQSGDSDWSSFEDQGIEGVEWFESNPTVNNLVELRPNGETVIASGETFELGSLFQTAGEGGSQDLEFRYLFPGDDAFSRFGEVVYQDLVGDLQGDYNSDGRVDAADYTVWRDGFGMNVAPGSGADGDADGVIGEQDYDIWRINYGARLVTGSGLASVQVPEPSGCVLLGLAAVGLSFARRSA